VSEAATPGAGGVRLISPSVTKTWPFAPVLSIRERRQLYAALAAAPRIAAGLKGTLSSSSAEMLR
jgi:hypothetical protein